ncbi:hypothetical protein C8R44DRAFT_740824 [Mycena epipterygia]|nr:hypothetical protein C8R44DRAFT_740824 [Mycena epipterygia]
MHIENAPLRKSPTVIYRTTILRIELYPLVSCLLNVPSIPHGSTRGHLSAQSKKSDIPRTFPATTAGRRSMQHNIRLTLPVVNKQMMQTDAAGRAEMEMRFITQDKNMKEKYGKPEHHTLKRVMGSTSERWPVIPNSDGYCQEAPIKPSRTHLKSPEHVEN